MRKSITQLTSFTPLRGCLSAREVAPGFRNYAIPSCTTPIINIFILKP